MADSSVTRHEAGGDKRNPDRDERMGKPDARIGGHGQVLGDRIGTAVTTGFTYDSYRAMLLALLQAGYKFLSYGAPDEPPVCYLRHDLDVTIEKAVRLSKIEHDLQIKSTYCIMLRTNSYNVLSPDNMKWVQEIINGGHYIGLHFDCSVYGMELTLEEIQFQVRREVKTLSEWVDAEVKMVSFHKPNPLILSGMPQITDPLPHAYEKKYLKDMTYLSDSYGFWRFGHPLEHRAFADRESLVLCAHPIWWDEKSLSPLYVLKQSMFNRREEIREYMLVNIMGL